MKGIKMIKDIKNNVSIVVIGFDGYKDVWDHYFNLINKYWYNRPKTYLFTNELTITYENTLTIPCGKNSEWSLKVKKAMEIIDTKYVVLLLEDFFTNSNVDSTKLYELISCMEKNDLKYCKLLNQSKIRGESFDNKDYLHVIPKDDKYGISLQPAIWEKEFLKELVGNENYNAWIFEFNRVANPIQNQNQINCIADDRNVLNITHAIVQSKYLRKAIKSFKKQNYIINTNERRQLTFIENLKYDLKCWFSEYTPTFLKPIFKSIGRLMKIDFVSDRQLGGKK